VANVQKQTDELPRVSAAMTVSAPLWTKNNQLVSLEDIPQLDLEKWHGSCVQLCKTGSRIVALFALPSELERGPYRILTAFANDSRGQIGLLGSAIAPGGTFPSLTEQLPQAQAFERDLFERTGILPNGHPWLKPLRRHSELENASDAGASNLAYEFTRVAGEDIHEVAVGPVHAGIIESGHFRFQCHGETVLSLEIQLGYQQRGAEELLLRSREARRLVIAESIAGDTAVGHAMAYCAAIETLAGCDVSLEALRIRGIALELERLANHVGDLGALCNDVGYLPGASFLGQLRGEFLNMLCTLSGNRFGRGLICPGGVHFGVTAEQCDKLQTWLHKAEEQVNQVADLVFDAGSVCSRFEQTGMVPLATAEDLGLVGPVARASGCSRDVRCDHAFGVYRFAHIPVSVAESGDVMGRAYVRWLESQRSAKFINEELEQLRQGPHFTPCKDPSPNAIVVSMVETWRGEAVHVAVSGQGGHLVDYRIIDPSFHNWLGLTMAVRGQQISDFPLCNKSFNLSYAGHDL
jgi:Ni,Fe-hydrogenase III large subunit